MRLNCAGDLHVALLGMTLSAANMAGETSDSGELDRARREILAHVHKWASHNRLCILEKHPELADMCAFDAAEELRAAGGIQAGLEGSLEAWVYAERMFASFVLRTASTPLAGVRLAYIYKDVHDASWPAVA